MIFTIPNSLGAAPLLEVNHCHGPGRGHPCVGGVGEKTMSAGSLNDLFETLEFSSDEDARAAIEDYPKAAELLKLPKEDRAALTPRQILDKLGIEVEEEFERLGYPDEKLYVVTLDGTPSVVDGMSVKTSEEWLSDVNDPTDYIDTGDFNKDFWSSPGVLYHATTEERAEGIEAEGLLPKNKTRGLHNRWTGSAVFTTTNLDAAAYGAYGNVIFEIDMPAMKRDGLRPEVAMEEGADRNEAWSALAHRIGIEDWSPDTTDPGGDDPETVVVFGNIPRKYLKRLE